MPTPSKPSAELLLDNLSWIRALASQLVSDENDRDDLVQATYVRALERPPRDSGGFQGWLATVMRNLAREERRGAGRRRAREESRASEELLEPTNAVVQRVTEQRELVQHVLEIDEPYRTALLLRYFEGLQPREIARRLELPVATIHSRQKRALAQLRERLDRSHGGDRAAWLALFTPLAAPSHAPTVTTLGALLVNVKLAAVLVTALVLGTVVTILNLPISEAPLASPAAELVATPELSPVPVSEPTEALGLAEPSSTREEVVPTTPAAPALATPEPTASVAPTLHLINGRVLDATGAPLFGFPVRIEGTDTVVVSGDDGRFELEATASECRLIAASPRWVTVREGYYRAGTFDPVLVVAPSIDLAGEVVSSAGQPLAGAQLRFDLPEGFDTRFTTILDATRRKSWTVLTDHNGRFELLDVPGVDASRLSVVLAGYQVLEREVPPLTDRALYFILERPSQPESGSLSGRVLTPEGQPVEAARVASGLTTALTDEDGMFHLDLSRAVTPTRVAAVKQGYLPAILERPFAPDRGNAGWPDFVELTLGGPALTLEGRVVDAEGKPVRGSRVWLLDTARFGTLGTMPTSFENLMDGADVPPDTVESERELPDEDGESLWKSTLSGAPSSAAWHWKLTDSEGRFEFGGLFDHSYRVRVLDLDSLVSFTSDELQPGSGVADIELPAAELYELVQGVVVDQSGAALEGVRVTLRADPYDESARVFGGTTQLIMTQHREQVLTDADGRFAFERVPKQGIRLVFESDEIVPTLRELADFAAGPTTILVEVDARCHLSIELELPGTANGFRFRDADGKHLSIHVISEGSHSSSSAGKLIDGKSGVVSVSGRARQLVLLMGEAEVAVLPIDLVPRELNQIRY